MIQKFFLKEVRIVAGFSLFFFWEIGFMTSDSTSGTSSSLQPQSPAQAQVR